MSEDTPKRPTGQIPLEPVYEMDTGKVQLIAKQVVDEYGNGALKRLEKGQRWVKVGLFYVGILATAAAGVWQWNNSLAKKTEQDALRVQVIEVGSKVDLLFGVIQQLKDEVKKNQERKR